MLEAQGSRALTSAVQYRAQVEQAVANMEATVAFLGEIQKRVAERYSVTDHLWGHADAATSAAEALADTFDPDRDAHAATLWRAIKLCQALAAVGRAGLVDDEGAIDPRTTAMLQRFTTAGELPS